MPAFPLCVQCLSLGYCRLLTTRVIGDADLSNPDFIRDLRDYARGLKIGRDRWLSFLENIYRDYPGEIIDHYGEPVYLDFACFETVSIRYWFRDFAESVLPPGVRPRLRGEARERIRIIATLLRARDPAGTALWGVRAANDGPGPVIQPKRIDPACPHKDRAVWSPVAANDN